MPSRTARAPPPAPGSSLSTDALIVGTSGIESRYAWIRLAASVLLGTIGGVGMWSIVVAMPAVQAEFAVDRGAASLPYTASMIGLMTGTVVIGRLSDRLDRKSTRLNSSHQCATR